MSTLEVSRPRVTGALERVRAVVSWAGLAGAALVVVAGLTIKAAGGQLGLPLPPFLMSWGPRASGLTVISVVVIAGALASVPAVVGRARAGLVYGASMYVLALALGLALNLAHEGVRGWWAVFATGRGGSREGAYEYLPSFPALIHGIPYYLAHFAALFPYLSLHAQGNPPGPMIALDLLGIRTAGGMTALCIGVGALTAPLAYDLGRVLGGDADGERRGRIAAVLTAFSPAILLFGVTSADYAFATLGMIVACLLVRPRAAALIGGALAAALASFCSWLLLAIPAWSALVVVRRDGWKAGVSVGAIAAAGVIGFNVILWILFGYDPVAALRATSHAYFHGTFRYRPYWFWLAGSPAAWSVMLGLPIFWLALRALGAGDAAAFATAAVVLGASVIGTTGGETERIWLPFAPLACVAAAAALPPLLPARHLRTILIVLSLQALAVELLFFTVW